MVTLPRPSSPKSLEVGPKQSDSFSVASPPHVVSRMHLCKPRFLEPSQKCLLFWILLRSGEGGARPPLGSRTNLLSSSGASEGQSCSATFGLSSAHCLPLEIRGLFPAVSGTPCFTLM